MNKSIIATAVASLVFVPSISFAQPSSDIDTMVVTANRFEQSTHSTIAQVSVVTKKDIERIQAKSIPDVLKRLTGIQITQNGGRGQLSSIYVRGTGADQVLVLVDGIRFSSAAKGAVDFNQLPLTYVDRIEYVRGARASLYGSEAIGGVINIITIANSKTENATKLKAGMGSDSYYEASVSTQQKTGKNGQLNVAIGYESTDGYNVKPVAGINDGDEHGFETFNGLVGYNHQVSSKLNVFGSFRTYNNVYQYDSSYGSRAYWESDVDNFTYVLGADFEHNAYTSSVLFNYQKQNSWNYEQENGKNDPSGYTDELEQRNIQWTNGLTLSDNTRIGGGVEWRNESYFDKSVSEEFDRDNIGIYGLLLSQWDDFTTEISLRNDDNENFGNQITYNVGLGWILSDLLNVRASYGTAFKAPNLYQLYDQYSGNISLSPEDANSAELIISGLLNDIYWSVTGYNIKIDDYIEYDYDTYSYTNLDGESHIKGVEFEFEFDTAMMTHKISADFKNPKDADGEQLKRRAKEIYKWNSTLSLDNVDIDASYQYVGKRPDSSSELSAYDVLNVSINYYFGDSTTLGMKVSNLLNEKYETAAGYPAAERSFYVSALYNF